MCGFTGFLQRVRTGGHNELADLAARMADRIHHRGPDSSGAWVHPERPLAFGHKRLAIIDLTAAGDQPMRSASGRYVIAYNGEIYNHLDIRAEIEAAGGAPAWRGHSDTETLLAAIELWGLKGALERSVGMFAFGLWDEREKELSLARDRLGEKPLYYGWQGRGSSAAFLFGSELKALAAHPAFEGEISRDVLSLYVRHCYVPGPFTIYRGISKLMPGCFLVMSAEGGEPHVEAYWSGRAAAEAGAADPAKLGPEEAVSELERLLSRSISRQMLADVPLGAFLSGGVDSSTVVALMQAQSSRPVRTFSIGFNEEAYNEAKHAKAVAEHLGTDHTEMYVTPREAMDVIPDLPSMYDEPFADSSQIPTFLVSQMARRHVTVSLSGDAGDELFGGYERYRVTSRFWSKIAKVPRPLRRPIARGLTSVSQSTWNSIAAFVKPVLPASARLSLPGDKIHKGAAILDVNSAAELYYGLVSTVPNPQDFVIGANEPATVLTRDVPQFSGLDDVERMMAADMLTYLPDDILVKVDRAAMSVSLETRVPLLDHEVVEYAWRLPLEYKIRDGQTKWALRQVLYRHVPRALIERPKMGFGVPVGEWLRGPMRDWAEALLDERRLREEGFFNPAPIRKMWDAHQSGHVNEQYRLWIILMFQAWLEGQQGVLGSRGSERVAPAAAA